MSNQNINELANTLRAVRDDVSLHSNLSAPDLSRSWELAQQVVEEFDPVPWFVRRLSKIAFGSSQSRAMPEGAVIGFDKLLRAAASDPIVGKGSPVEDVREARNLLEGDVFAALVVMHSVSKRVLAKGYQRMWMPILDQALVRAQIGYCIASKQDRFGSGRGMLAGFASRVGLCILMVRGSLTEGNQVLEILMKNPNVSEVGMEVYGCNPLHIGAFLLSVVGCGSSAALGFVAYASEESGMQHQQPLSDHQKYWVHALEMIEGVRNGNLDSVSENIWSDMGLSEREERLELEELAHSIKRRGHNWQWLL